MVRARKLRPNLCRVLVAAALAAIGLSQPSGSEAAARRGGAGRDDDTPTLEQLQREVERLAARAGGTVGVSAVHLESGRGVALNADTRFPMSSVFKIPIAVRVLTLVDHGELTLAQPVTVRKEDIRPGSGALRSSLHPGLTVTVRRLPEGMLTLSDNTAADLLLRLAGGPAAVTERMRELGLSDIDVSRPMLRVLADEAGAELEPLPEEPPLGAYVRALRQVTPEHQAAAKRRFATDRRDAATPSDMVRLLTIVRQGDALTPASTDLLLDLMRRCQTGKSRLPRLLPPGTSVAHKTGTIGSHRNDVGYISLPRGAGTIAVAIFVRSSEGSANGAQQAFGRIARALYDYFLHHRTAMSPSAGRRTRGLP